MNTREEYEKRLHVHSEQVEVHRAVEFRDNKNFVSILNSVILKSFMIAGVAGIAYWLAAMAQLIPSEERALHHLGTLALCALFGSFFRINERKSLSQQRELRNELYSVHDESLMNSNNAAQTEFMAYKECLAEFPRSAMSKHEKRFKLAVGLIISISIMTIAGLPMPDAPQNLFMMTLGAIAVYQWFKFKRLRNVFLDSRDTILDKATYHLLEAKIRSHR